VATSEHRERCDDVVSQKEPYSPPSARRPEYREVEVGVESVPRSDVDVHANQNRCFRARALQESGMKEMVPQSEVELNPHITLAQGHKGRFV
jgi:hypothetical protein